MSELWKLSATEVARLVRSREVSARGRQPEAPFLRFPYRPRARHGGVKTITKECHAGRHTKLFERNDLQESTHKRVSIRGVRALER